MRRKGVAAQDPDLVRAKHMLEAIKEAVGFLKNKSVTELSEDRMLALSLIKEIEIIGEAASQITVQFREKYPEVPWRLIIATRNRLVHGYFDIDYGIVWQTIKTDLPELGKLLQKVLKQPKS